MRTSSLDIQEEKNKEDQEGRIIKIQMDDANKAIRTLSMELSELQKLVRARRTNGSVIDCLLVLLLLLLGDGFPSTEESDEFPSKSSHAHTVERLTKDKQQVSLERHFLALFFYSPHKTYTHTHSLFYTVTCHCLPKDLARSLLRKYSSLVGFPSCTQTLFLQTTN